MKSMLVPTRPVISVAVVCVAAACSAMVVAPATATAGELEAREPVLSQEGGANALSCLVSAEVPNVVGSTVFVNGRAACSSGGGVQGCVQVNDGGWRDLSCSPVAFAGPGDGTGTSISAGCLPNVTREYRGRITASENQPGEPEPFSYTTYSTIVLC